jgi:hypothetical protein
MTPCLYCKISCQHLSPKDAYNRYGSVARYQCKVCNTIFNLGRNGNGQMQVDHAILRVAGNDGLYTIDLDFTAHKTYIDFYPKLDPVLDWEKYELYTESGKVFLIHTMDKLLENINPKNAMKKLQAIITFG